jgi:hypothetical protein
VEICEVLQSVGLQAVASVSTALLQRFALFFTHFFGLGYKKGYDDSGFVERASGGLGLLGSGSARRISQSG